MTCLKRAEVAALFGVKPRTITGWAMAGKIPCVFTPGGHRRFPEAEIRALAAEARTWDARV